MIQTRTRLILVIHYAECVRTTNTGLLAAACLANSEVVVRGRFSSGSEALPLPVGTQPVVLFPADDAVPLGDLLPSLASVGAPVTLVVPDGNWRQASKVRARVPGLGAVPCVKLPSGPPSTYRLRTEAHTEGMATIEAIARAMGMLEGPHVREALERPFQMMVERTLWSRGSVSSDEVTTGIPRGVMRHDPHSGGL